MRELNPNNLKPSQDALTIAQALTITQLPGTVMPLTSFPLSAPTVSRNFTAFEPTKMFDNMFWVGTDKVGSFIVNTTEGVVMIDTGYGDNDLHIMLDGIKKVGLDPANIKLIILSHEHADHYGGVLYLKKNICPEARVALSLTGWNMLQTVPIEWAYGNPRPQHIDIYLVDRMRLKVGDTTFQVVATPGHSPGCMSFILPVQDNGVTHVFGFMGGTAVWPTQVETRQYQASIEYFKAFALAAKCDAGFGVHVQYAQLSQLRTRKTGEPNPLIVGTEKYDSVYLQQFRNNVKRMLDSGTMTPYSFPAPPPTTPPPTPK